MKRIFFSLSLFVVILLLVCNVHGLLGGDYNRAWQTCRDQQLAMSPKNGANAIGDWEATHQEFLRIQGSARLHTLLGLFVALVAVLLNCLSATYFIGTARWCKEVSAAYGLSDDLVTESTRLKRKNFPWALIGVLTTLAVAASGAASDPGTLMPGTQQWVVPHRYASFAGTAIIIWALAQQVQYIGRNQTLIDRIVQQVRHLREARGLPV